MSEVKSETPTEAKSPSRGLSGISSRVALGKDAVALLRDGSIFLLALLLVFFPTAFNSILTKAGFEEGSLVGFKWKGKLIDSDAALKEARATITDLQSQLAKTSQALVEAQSKPNDPGLKDRVTKLQEENKQLDAVTTQVQASVSSTISSNAPLVEQAQSRVGASEGWGVVYSGDPTIEKATYEVGEVARKYQIPNASVYFRAGSYRGVSVSEDRTQAEQVLPKAKQRRSDAYIVNMSTWCPKLNEKEGYRECVRQ